METVEEYCRLRTARRVLDCQAESGAAFYAGLRCARYAGELPATASEHARSTGAGDAERRFCERAGQGSLRASAERSGTKSQAPGGIGLPAYDRASADAARAANGAGIPEGKTTRRIGAGS